MPEFGTPAHRINYNQLYQILTLINIELCIYQLTSKPMSTVTLRQKYLEVLSKTFHEHCLENCLPKMGSANVLAEEEKSCLKNCGGKIQGYFEVAKSVGFPVA